MNKGKSTPFSFKPTAKIIAISIAAAFALSACGGGGGNDPSRVDVSTSGAATAVAPGSSADVTLTFTSKDGSSTGLNVTTDLTALPAGWTASPAPYTCDTVTSDSGSCPALTLTYAPTAETPASTLTIEYQYVDDKGVMQTGTTTISYSASLSGGGTLTAYVTQLGADAGPGGILQCSADAAGMLTCAPSGDASANALPAPFAIALNGSSAYILNGATGGETPTTEKIYKCSVTDNAITACAEETGADNEQLSGAKDIAISGSNLYVLKESQILKCGLTGGTVGACSGEGMAVTGLNVAESFAFSGNRVWIANSGAPGSVAVCDVADGTGLIPGCTEAWPGAEGDPAPLAIAINGSNAYIVQRNDNSVLKCAVAEATGALICDESATALPAVEGAEPQRIAVNNGYLYVTTAPASDSAPQTTNDVVKCTIGEGGAIVAGSCVSGVVASDPAVITGTITDITF